MLDSLGKLVTESGFAGFFSNPDGWRNLVMIAIACVLLYLGIKKQYEPLLMVGIAMDNHSLSILIFSSPVSIT